MDTNAYRRKIEQSVAKAEAGHSRAPSRTAKKAGVRHSGSPSRTAKAAPQDLVANRKTPAKTRAEALGRLTSAEGPDTAPDIALERLADPKESPVVRLAAIKLLQQKQFFSPIAAEWRPAFVDALRAAVRDPKVRPAALEVLSLFKDRATQELLLEGVRRPAKALVPLKEALRLLSTDVHADVVDVAKKVTTTPRLRKDKDAFVQAVRILAADPASIGKLQEVVANNAYAMDARRVAATALSHLSPDALQQTPAGPQAARAKRAARGTGAKSVAAGKVPGKLKGALAKHLETLRRVRG